MLLAERFREAVEIREQRTDRAFKDGSITFQRIVAQVRTDGAHGILDAGKLDIAAFSDGPACLFDSGLDRVKAGSYGSRRHYALPSCCWCHFSAMSRASSLTDMEASSFARPSLAW